MPGPATLIINPGLRDAAPQHWQSLLAAQWRQGQGPVIEVATFGRDDLSLDKRIFALNEAVLQAGGPSVIAAHSGGCITVAHWIRRLGPQGIDALRPTLRGILLATPANLERPLPAGYPDQAALQAQGWAPLPRAKLGLPSVVAISHNDPLCPLDDAKSLADAWGSVSVDLGDVGHLNPASGFGPWPQAQLLINQLLALD